MKKIFWLFLSLGILFTFFGCKNAEKKSKMKGNPLLAEIYDTPGQVPPFDQIKLDDYLPAFEKAIEMHNKEIEEIINNPEPPTFENTIVALDRSGKVLRNVSLIFFNLNEAATSPEMQEIAMKVSSMLTEHMDNIWMNDKLFQRVKAVYDKKEELNLSEQDSMLLEKIYRNFVKNGALLSPEDKQRLQEINKRLSVLTLKFGQNVLAEVNRYKLVIDNPEDLAGLPENLIEQAAEMAKKTGDSGKWVFTIHRSVITPFLTYSQKRNLREEIFTAYITKGNHDDSLDNKAIVNEIVNLRVEKAHLLGYDTWADYRLQDRMAKTPENVYKMLNDIWKYALPAAKNEANKLQQLIYEEGNDFDLMPWDWWYYAEKLRKKEYNLDENELRPYFVLDNVLEKGVFYTLNRLYGLTFRKAEDLPVYHPDVVVYRVFQGNDSLIGILYLDFYPRESKRGGAWSTEFRPQYYENGKRVYPIVSIVTNFTKPTETTPSLLSLDEVLTLFHEFGHAIHTLLSNVKYATLSGTNVPLDFVELPSQIMEEWALMPEVLKKYAIHYKTGQIMPDSLIEKIQKSRTFNQGFATVEYMAAAYLDMDWHTVKEQQQFDVNQFEKQSMDRIGLIPQIVVRYRSTYFNHIFAGGYSAGYYSYLWADVLVQDAFDYFRQEGIFNPEVAKKFRHLLEMGGSVDAMKLYVQFRGHEPDVKPLLRARGFIE